MTQQGHKKARHGARTIKTKRDFEGAEAVAKRLAAQAKRDQDAEVRLQSLLKELDKFDTPEDEDGAEGSGEYDYPGPPRRWSDSSSDRE